MKELRNWLIEEECGQGMVEYGLIIVVIALGVVTIMGTVKGDLVNAFTKVSEKLQEAGK